MATFDNGSLVQLKSGGPKMTINSVVTAENNDPQSNIYMIALNRKYPMCNEFYLCSWFNDRNELKQEFFPVTSLQSVD